MSDPMRDADSYEPEDCARHYREEDQSANDDHAADLGFSLDHLRILTGPVCDTHWGSDGEIIPATIRDGGRDWCEPCHDRASEGAWESHCEQFYGGSGPSDQDRFEQSRDCGRKL